jgi:HAD superfamily phosphatase
MLPLNPRAVLLFDIDGVIRDVGGSYRRAIVETVHHYSGWRPDPAVIDALKGEGCWNNDWEASLELLRRHHGSVATPSGDSPMRPARTVSPSPPAGVLFPAGSSATTGAALPSLSTLPSLAELVEVFGGFYFGGDPQGDPALWRGFIGSEPLLVGPALFTDLNDAGIAWGFVSGSEPPSVRYVLQQRLGLMEPPVIAMGDAPDKPDPTGLLRLAEAVMAERWGLALGAEAPPVAYLGDTVADVQTVQRARLAMPGQPFLSLAVAPPHLHGPDQLESRRRYEQRLEEAGADRILPHTNAVLPSLLALLADREVASAPSPPAPSGPMP